MGVLSGRVAIVTGGGGGIGRAEGMALSQHGAAVVVNDLDAALAEETAQAIRDQAGKRSSTRKMFPAGRRRSH